MNKIKLALIASAFLAGMACYGQSSSEQPGTLNQLTQNIISELKDHGEFITNDVGDIDTGILYDSTLAKGKVGCFLSGDIPTTNQVAVGFGAAYLNNQFYDAQVTLKLGTTTVYPLIGKTYSFIYSGPDYSFKSHAIGAYNFAGVEKAWDIGKVKWLGPMGNHLILRVTASVGDISSLPGTILEVGGGVSSTF